MPLFSQNPFDQDVGKYSACLGGLLVVTESVLLSGTEANANLAAKLP